MYTFTCIRNWLWCKLIQQYVCIAREGERSCSLEQKISCSNVIWQMIRVKPIKPLLRLYQLFFLPGFNVVMNKNVWFASCFGFSTPFLCVVCPMSHTAVYQQHTGWRNITAFSNQLDNFMTCSFHAYLTVYHVFHWTLNVLYEAIKELKQGKVWEGHLSLILVNEHSWVSG